MIHSSAILLWTMHISAKPSNNIVAHVNTEKFFAARIPCLLVQAGRAFYSEKENTVLIF